MVDSKTITRPTPIDKEIYISFGNACRTNGSEIGDTIESLLKLYIEKGEELFT